MQQIAPSQTYEMLPHAHKLEVRGRGVLGRKDSRSTHSVNTSFPHFLSIHPINTFYQPTLLPHPIYTSYQPTLSINPLTPHYPSCCSQVFEYALANTTGEDLAKILWLKSETSETWLQRRANYTRSLAVMSMVGYVLGLGDRHPSNLMLDRKSGKVLHIDFGDCFEVAMQREKFPERVPFRLVDPPY